MTSPSKDEVAEERQSLWLLTISLAIWSAHFLISYIGAAIWCGRLVERTAGLEPLRVSIIGLAVIALIGIGITGRAGWEKHSHGSSEPPHDEDTPEDRHRFLGFATVLLTALSAILPNPVDLEGSSIICRSFC
jgi:hypothetical protein